MSNKEVIEQLKSTLAELTAHLAEALPTAVPPKKSEDVPRWLDGTPRGTVFYDHNGNPLDLARCKADFSYMERNAERYRSALRMETLEANEEAEKAALETRRKQVEDERLEAQARENVNRRQKDTDAATLEAAVQTEKAALLAAAAAPKTSE